MPYRPTERTEARKARVREGIVAAALDQVAAGGYASASVQAVATRAEVATGTVYRHFPSKSELFAEVFRRAAEHELAVLREVGSSLEAPASERIAAVVEAGARRALAGPTLAYAQIAEPVDPRVEAERLTLRRGYRDLFAELLREGVEAGELAPLDVDTAAAGLLGAISEALVGPTSPVARRQGGRGSREAFVAALVQFCLNAVHSRRSDVHAHAHA
jgi:AcrR family transcriptional regulator